MAVDYTFVVKKIQNLEQLFVLFAGSTRLPFVECDPEEFDDQVYLFAEEEAAKEKAEEYKKNNMPVVVVKIEKKGMPGFYTNLHLMGVNMLVFHDATGSTRLALEKVAQLDPKIREKSAEIPLINSSLQLTIVYFLQELRRPNQPKDDQERMKKLQELEEEMVANLLRSKFIMAVDVSQVTEGMDLKEANKKIQIPYVKTQNGDIYQPLFSDAWEFQKFQKKPDAKLRMAAVPFKGLLGALVKQAKGFVLNPQGVNLVLSREQLERMIKQEG